MTEDMANQAITPSAGRITVENRLEGSICNPKQKTNVSTSVAYPYYAGYSRAFVDSALKSTRLTQDSIILDPWNGAGTTTSCASDAGFHSIGIDLNPVMNIIAAGVRGSGHLTSINQAIELVSASYKSRSQGLPTDSLHSWFTEKTVANIRRFIKNITGSKSGTLRPQDSTTLADPVALVLICLFRLLKDLYSKSPYKSSNPTWVRPIELQSDRISIEFDDLISHIKAQLENFSKAALPDLPCGLRPLLILADSRAIPLETGKIDAVITSPPYCTRIDYAIKMSIEHSAAFGKLDFDRLRKELLGTTTIENIINPSPLGPYCIDLLNNIRLHSSKASGTYYLKNIKQYLDGLSQSIKEIGRVLSEGGNCFIVVQDSHYKEIPISLDIVVRELGQLNDLVEVERFTFSTNLAMSNINTASRRYGHKKIGSQEHVLHLIKEAT